MAAHKRNVKRGKGTHKPEAQMAGDYPGFLSMKYAQEYCYSPVDGMLVHRRVNPQQCVAGTHLNTSVKRNKVK